MARPTTIRDDIILKAARELFRAHGTQTTTAQIAERAGVSEGSVFKRWKTKGELYRAAMSTASDEPPWEQMLTRVVGQGDVRENLMQIGTAMAAYFRPVLPLIVMAWSNPGEGGPPLGLDPDSDAAVRGFKRMIGYFEVEMRAGRLRRHEPGIVARCFMGSILSFVMFESLQMSRDDPPMPLEVYLRGLVNAIWSGIAPQAPKR